MVACLGIGAIFLSQLYQSLLLAALLTKTPEVRFKTVDDVADAIASGEYRLLTYVENALTQQMLDTESTLSKRLLAALRWH